MTIKKLITINNIACRYYRDQLKKSPQVQNYIRGRISGETSNMFGLGYAPPTMDLLDILKDDLEDAVEAGLFVADEYENVFQRFKNRVMLPIVHAGKIVGFGGRTLGNDRKKYLNSPATALYNKSEVLYGLHWSRKYIEKLGHAVIVEGYFDVLGLFDNNLKNVCSPCGTAITPQHILSLKRYCNEVYLMMDPDMAGRKAALKARKLLKDMNVKSKLFNLPSGKDPDELIVEIGKKKLYSYLEN